MTLTAPVVPHHGWQQRVGDGGHDTSGRGGHGPWGQSEVGERVARQQAADNLAKLRTDFPKLYGPGGFLDEVDVASGKIAEEYKIVAMGMTMSSLGDVLAHDDLRSAFAAAADSKRLIPVLEPESWDVRPAAPAGTTS